MKKIFFVFVFLSALALNGAELFYNNGSSISIKKANDFSVVKTSAAQAANLKNVFYRMNTGRVVYSFVKGNGGELPVYFLGNTPVVAEKMVFWRGKKPVDEMEKKYGMKLVEIFLTYPLYAFAVQGDSVEISETIVKNGDGYAFPDLVRETQLHSEPEGEPEPEPEDLNFIPESEPKDPYFDVQWHLQNNGEVVNNKGKMVKILKNADIKFIQALEFLNSNGIEVNPNTKIAIMDTGVDKEHEDLTNVETGYDSIEKTDGGYPNPDKVEETPNSASHGTSCAGISAATGNETGMSGVCPWCGIYPVRWLSGGSGSTTWSGTDLLTIYEKYTADPNITTINCSFGPTYSDVNGNYEMILPDQVTAFQNFMQNGRNGLGGVIVYSSGNDNVNSSYQQHFEYDFTVERNGVEVTDRVVTVNASTAWDTRAEYSNFGYATTVTAPSGARNPWIRIATTAIPGKGYYPSDGSDYTIEFGGTSAAAPVVSGIFGVLFSINPELTLEEAIAILKQSADKINPETGFWDENGFSVKYGYGRVNLEKAVRLAVGQPMCAEIKDEECGNNLDDDCDGYVDEGCAEELTAGKPCETDNDCLTESLTTADVKCLKEMAPYVFKGGYCLRRSTNTAPCPDGTKNWDLEKNFKYCALECNKFHPCEREGYRCSDEVLGICLQPLCSDNSDCTQGYVCDEDGSCKKPIGGKCSADNQCAGAHTTCDTTSFEDEEGGYCTQVCLDNDDDFCPNEAKCVTTASNEASCLASCTSDKECRRGDGHVCHPLMGSKSGVCYKKCTQNSDCNDENAICNDKGYCATEGWHGWDAEEPDEEPENDADEQSDSDETAADSEISSDEDEISLDDDTIETADSGNEESSDAENDDDTATKKEKSGGCSVIVF